MAKRARLILLIGCNSSPEPWTFQNLRHKTSLYFVRVRQSNVGMTRPSLRHF